MGEEGSSTSPFLRRTFLALLARVRASLLNKRKHHMYPLPQHPMYL